jgi:hypothetical protein
MSAGDIIDRAVRLYRRHFLTLLRIVLAPSLIAYAGGIAYTVGARHFSLVRGETRAVLTGALVLGGIGLYLGGKIAFFAMLGGTSRALVDHFFSGTPLTARAVFQTVASRWRSLAGATIIVLALLVAVIFVLYLVLALPITFYALISVWIAAHIPVWLQVLWHVAFILLAMIGAVVLFLLVYGRVIFVPQALLVEEKGVFSAIGRSVLLAGRDVRRIAAILLFQIYVAWSLLLLLVIPLGWYAYLQGVDINPFSASAPLWYNVAQQTLTQLSEILLAPIAILSFTLLYLDVRVRQEGFDLELLANRVLPPARYVEPASPEVVPEAPVEETREVR